MSELIRIYTNSAFGVSGRRLMGKRGREWFYLFAEDERIYFFVCIFSSWRYPARNYLIFSSCNPTI